MTTANNKSEGFRLPILQGVLPIKASQIPTELIAGLTLAALAIPEVMGYTKIAGTPVITGLYTILIPMALFALFGSSRHLVVGADSATAAILAAGFVGLASVGSDEYVALAGVLALMAGGLSVPHRCRSDRRRGLLGGRHPALQLRHLEGTGHPPGVRGGRR